jgi:hypothetical protein
VSHQPERKEKDCLNCGAEVLGPYCQNCGQKNTVVHQNFWQLLTHFIYDIFHFDGKFFDTLKRLLFRPGLVPKEYVQGRRFSYLDPIRMYLFTSAVFFLVFFSISRVGETFSFDNPVMSYEERYQAAAQVYASLRINPSDSFAYKKLGMLLDTTKSIVLKNTSTVNVTDTGNLLRRNNTNYLMFPENTFMLEDSSQSDDWMDKRMNAVFNAYRKQYGDDLNKMSGVLMDRFTHQFPYMLFVSLPLFALILKLLYRRRKAVYYSDHAVFTLYHYIFSFILLLLYWGFDYLLDKSGWAFFQYLQTALIITWPIYLLLSMKRFYAQGWGKTIIKFLLLNLLGLLAILLIFALFSVLFIFQL